MSNRVLLSHAVCAALGAVALSSGVAFAQSSSATQRDERIAQDSTVQFRLTSQRDVKLIRFAAPRAFRICDLTDQSASDGSDLDFPLETWSPLADSAVPVTLRVSYAGETRDVAPGECYELRTSYLQLSTSEPLVGDQVLSGSLHLRHLGPAVSTASNDSALRSQLARDDQMMRESAAEFHQAGDDLRKASHSLEATRRTEGAVQRDEAGVRQAELRQAAMSS